MSITSKARLSVLAAFLCPAVSLLPPLTVLPASAQDVLITNARVFTGEAGDYQTIENGAVLVRGDQIAGVGRMIRGGAGTTEIDAQGAWVTPGIINAYTTVGLVEIGSIGETRDSRSGNDHFSAGFDVAYGASTAGSTIAVTRLEGTTRVAAMPSATSSIFAGAGAVLQLGMGLDPVMQPRAFMVAEMGERGAELSGGARGAAFVMMREALKEAAGSSSSDRFDNLLSRIDVEALRPVVRGQMPLFVHVERASDIVKVLDMKRAFPLLELVLTGVNEGWMVADQLAAAQIPVIVDVTENMPRRFEVMASTFANAARLNRAGVTLAIATGPSGNSGNNARLITQLAGMAVAYGLPHEAALSAITRDAAEILGIDSDLGTLSPGKKADLVIWDGDPLEITSSPTAVYIVGIAMPMESRQTKLRDRYMDLNAGTLFQYRK